jgi:hypothetical protein
VVQTVFGPLHPTTPELLKNFPYIPTGTADYT